MKFLAIIILIFSVANAAPYASVGDNSIEEDVELVDLSHYDASIFMEPSNLTGNLVAEYNPDTDDMNPEELDEYLEGDMLMPPSLARNGSIASASHWPGCIVPFEISGYFDANAMDMIERAINEYHRRKQPVNLQVPGCTVKVGTIIHEMMHALGFFHEQNRSDIDDFVCINWHIVSPGTQVNFDKQSSITTTTCIVGYDYGSVMHFSVSGFSKNGQPAIPPKRYGASMGQRDAFTTEDTIKINKMYKCPVEDGSSEEEKPSLNAHNNIEALIGDAMSTENNIKPSSMTTSRPHRPSNRPFLQAVGNLVGQALSQKN